MFGVTSPEDRLPIAPRYVGLLFASMLCILFGFAYTPLSNLPAKLPLGLDILSRFIPLWVFGAAWLAVGAAGLFCILTRRRGVIPFACMSGIMSMWTIAYVSSWILGEPRGWVTAGIFAGLTGMVLAFTRVDPPLWVLRLGSLWTR